MTKTRALKRLQKKKRVIAVGHHDTFFSGHQVIKMDDHSFLEKTYSFAGETPTQWLKSNIPELSYYTYRRKQVNANDFFFGFSNVVLAGGKEIPRLKQKKQISLQIIFQGTG